MPVKLLISVKKKCIQAAEVTDTQCLPSACYLICIYCKRTPPLSVTQCLSAPEGLWGGAQGAAPRFSSSSPRVRCSITAGKGTELPAGPPPTAYLSGQAMPAQVQLLQDSGHQLQHSLPVLNNSPPSPPSCSFCSSASGRMQTLCTAPARTVLILAIDYL